MNDDLAHLKLCFKTGVGVEVGGTWARFHPMFQDLCSTGKTPEKVFQQFGGWKVIIYYKKYTKQNIIKNVLPPLKQVALKQTKTKKLEYLLEVDVEGIGNEE